MTSKGAVGALSIRLANSLPVELAPLYFGLPLAAVPIASAAGGSLHSSPAMLLAAPAGLALAAAIAFGIRHLRAARRR